MQKSKEKNKVKKIRFVLLLIVVAIIAVICKIILNKSESTVSNIATNYENNETELTETLTWDISASDDDDVIATLTTDGVLTISGTGAMTDWSSTAPWYSYEAYIIEAIIEDGVTNIGKSAFSNCTTLTNIDLSGCTGLTSIGSEAFEYCTSLTSLDLSGTKISTLPSFVFQGCTNLTTVSLPEDLVEIKQAAFYKCTSLTTIEIGSAVTSLFFDSDLFYGCTSLTSIEVNENNEYYSSEDGVLFNKDKTQIIRYPAGKEGETYTIPEGVTRIRSYAFNDCINLINIEISESVTTIIDSAFNRSEKLISIEVNENNENYSSEDGVLFNKDMTELVRCPEGREEETYTIPESVTSIESYAFYHCANLINIDLSNCTGLTSIGSYGFVSCTSLTSIDLSNCTELTSMGYAPFRECTSLKNVDLSNCIGLKNIWDYAFQECTSLTSIDLSNCTGLTSIGDYAFQECTSLTSIDLSNCTGLTSIEKQAFYKCISLTSIDLNDCTGLTSIGDYAFYNCTSLASIDLSNCTGLTSIEDYTFRNCTSLTSIEISKTITSIGEYVFCDCTSLTSIDLSNCTELTSIGVAIFWGDTSLTSIDLSNCTELTEIGGSAFRDCSSLTSIEIPESVTSIGDRAFYDCTSLTITDIPDSVTSIGSRAFYGVTYEYSIELEDKTADEITIDLPDIIKRTLDEEDIMYANGSEPTLTNCTISYDDETITFSIEDLASGEVSIYIKGGVLYGMTVVLEVIDTTAPSIINVTVTTNSITITAEDDLSGIVGYALTSEQTAPDESEYTSCIDSEGYGITELTDQVVGTGLTAETTYYVWLIDGAGNVNEGYAVTTESMPELDSTTLTTTLSESDWTNEDITVTAETTYTDFTLQYSIGGTTWSEYSSEGITVTENCTIYFRLSDGTNLGEIYKAVTITNIDKVAPTAEVSYSTTEATNGSVTVTITASEEIQSVSGWTLSSDSLTLTKTYTANASETITIYDLAGNSIEVTVTVTNIDTTAPTAEVSYSTTETTNGSVTVTITASEEIQSVSGWTLSSDSLTLTKTYTANASGTVTIYDLAGNSTQVTVTITNIDTTAPTAEVSYSTTEATNGSVTVTITASEEIQGVSGWTLSSDSLTLTKTYTANASETVTIYDLAGNSIEIEVTITNISTDNTDDDDNEEDTKETYTLYLYDGSTLLSSTSITEGDTITISDLSSVTKDGYTFAGWIDSDGNSVTGTLTVTGDIYLYASWTANNTDDGDEEEDTKETYILYLYNGDTLYSSQEITEGDTITVDSLPTLTQSGNIFNGWADSDGNIIEEDIEVTGNITLYASWTENSSEDTDNSDDDDNSTNTGTTNSTSSTNSSTSTNSTNTSTTNSDSTTATTSLPYTGTKALLIGIIAIFVVIAVVVRRKWNNLKGV